MTPSELAILRDKVARARLERIASLPLCRECFQPYAGGWVKAGYCGKRCYMRAYERRADRRAYNREWMRRRRGTVMPSPKPCDQCGESFVPSIHAPFARFCGKYCRYRFHDLRRKAVAA